MENTFGTPAPATTKFRLDPAGPLVAQTTNVAGCDDVTGRGHGTEDMWGTVRNTETTKAAKAARAMKPAVDMARFNKAVGIPSSI